MARPLSASPRRGFLFVIADKKKNIENFNKSIDKTYMRMYNVKRVSAPPGGNIVCNKQDPAPFTDPEKGRNSL